MSNRGKVIVAITFIINALIVWSAAKSGTGMSVDPSELEFGGYLLLWFGRVCAFFPTLVIYEVEKN